MLISQVIINNRIFLYKTLLLLQVLIWVKLSYSHYWNFNTFDLSTLINILIQLSLYSFQYCFIDSNIFSVEFINIPLKQNSQIQFFSVNKLLTVN